MPDETAQQTRVTIRKDTDILLACHKARALAAQSGFSNHDQALIAIATSEIAHNIVRHAQRGEITLTPIRGNGRRGLVVVARDEGPGIADVEQALQDGYSTSGGLGLGLSGARRLMDEFEIVSEVGKGTTVTMKKWEHNRHG